MIIRDWRRLNESGYTLIEMLLVLVLLSSVLLIAFPVFGGAAEAKSLEYFFEQLELDLYESQMSAMSEGITVRVVFSPENGTYRIRHGVRTVKTRYFPSGLSVASGTLDYNELLFMPGGTVSKSGSLIFNHRKDSYLLMFQFVRGRFYIEKL
ncbi:prepilin-type N-terminal cleavage/methylation domain-containing protein [Evansella sp. LMS18]|uniref:competence type IV pilus minor pilin ComGD n=1 Tax=Evansella sp. LMS18 TaxID=2924033 RepID=UPI0020D02615|nr:competence type IV pilus minor pilin ComGD [Evansella sp. LMS18]UTR09441.1 prepilin-type N-terminal cleavage/methylation domain-containing protein [Evansella sp. LMS18]